MEAEKSIQLEKVLAEACGLPKAELERVAGGLRHRARQVREKAELERVAGGLRHRARQVREKAELEAGRLEQAAKVMEAIANPSAPTPKKKPGLPPEVTQEIAGLYHQGKDPAEIAAALGLEYRSVANSIASMKARGRLQDAD